LAAAKELAMLFRNRTDAGMRLGVQLADYVGARGLIVLALPRGGVPVGFQVATALTSALDVFLVRKLGVPGHPELAMGAIAENDVEVLNEPLIHDLGIPRDRVRQVAIRERLELARRARLFRGDRFPFRPQGRTVIVIDDGLATGSTMEAAVVALRGQAPARIVVAIPVGARDACERLGRLVDTLVCLEMPDPFDAVGRWYQEFEQTSDAEVVALLAMANPAPPPVDL
jgi:putative phosphoribosyl transferase